MRQINLSGEKKVFTDCSVVLIQFFCTEKLYSVIYSLSSEWLYFVAAIFVIFKNRFFFNFNPLNLDTINSEVSPLLF